MSAGIVPYPSRCAGSSRCAPVAEQGLVGHDQVDLERHVGRGCLSGDALHEGVGHDLPAAARVALPDQGVGLAAERGVGGDALRDREQAGEPAHGVRGGPEPDAAVVLRGAGAREVAVRVEAVGQLLRLGLHPPVAQLLQPRREFGVDRARCSAESHAVSRATSIARHSDTRPVCSCAKVAGNSVVRMLAQPV